MTSGALGIVAVAVAAPLGLQAALSWAVADDPAIGPNSAGVPNTISKPGSLLRCGGT